ncbi:MAG: hypothetical protein K5746_00370 [Clostridiales bacterium]|nr:hypothetical protein [Clostridiales bacterium]
MRRAARGAALLAGLVVLAVVMNWIAVFVDTPRMRENAAQGAFMLCEEGATPELVGGFKTSQPDNYTSVLILKTAAYTGGEPILFRVFGGYRTDLSPEEGEDSWSSFCHVADGRDSPTGGLSYSRYWHGYTLPLRLLLCFFNLSNIEMLLYFAEAALLAALLLLMQQRKLLQLLPGFIGAWFVMMPAILGLCLQYAPVTLLTLMACCLLLFRWEAIDDAVSLPVFFAAVGLLTSYFDLLTFPTATLAFPMVFNLALRRQAGESAGKTFYAAALSAFAWGTGFAGMWALKWALNLLVFPIGAGGILSQIRLRVSNRSHGKRYTRTAALARNARLVFIKASSIAVLALSCAASLLAGLSGGRKKQPDPGCLAYLIPALLPVLWMLFTANHVWDHYYYTYRNLCGAIFSVTAMLSDFRRAGRGPEPKNLE